MTRDRETLLRDLADAVIRMDEVRSVEVAEEALQAGVDAYEAISQGLSAGMEVVSEKYDREEYFVPEILLCSDAMYAALEILRPHIQLEQVEQPVKIVIGVIEGDIHDIGKNIVKIMLDTAGFEMHDLGRDVPIDSFVGKAREVGAEIIALSTLMSTTMGGMGKVIEKLQAEGIREQHKVLIGGCPLSPAFAQQIGADAFGSNATEAIRLAKELGGIA